MGALGAHVAGPLVARAAGQHSASASLAPAKSAWVGRSLVSVPARPSRGRPTVLNGWRSSIALSVNAVGVTEKIERPFKTSDVRLALEDGSVWRGVAFGSRGTTTGEVVFNTSLTGYQEILTDPSYKGQFVTFTLPHIGNVGINLEDMESKQCHLGAVVVRDLSLSVSNYRSAMSLETYLIQQNVMGIANIDTRALTKRLRDTGCLVGTISTDTKLTDDDLIKRSKSWSIAGKDLIAEVTTRSAYEWVLPTDKEWEFAVEPHKGPKMHVVAYDFGIKLNILKRLASYGCRITVVPANTPAKEVMAMKPDGVFLSNGPGDPSAVPYAVANVKEILGKVPMFGICMGHQVLGQALGSTTFKLKFGHHGGNHPVKYTPTSRIEISAQNHNYAVDPAKLPAGVEVTHVNLNDGTCAGIRYPAMKALSLQYHPESSPGPHDSDNCFAEFMEMMGHAKKNKK